ncbi:hypothetical protein [Aeromonas hydrophila]|uniref:hypothetical protein n=1 Tax=Aeromonas hydrophila TaxID=644 RepID=UPI003D1F8FA3
MKAPEQLFFQSVKVVGGREVPIYNLVSGSYKEAIELNGPQLQLTLNDSDSSLADDYGLIEGAVCDVRMGDSGSNARAAYFASRFTIISAVPQGDHLLICAIEKGVYDIKQPVPRPKIYGDMTPAQILADLFPGYKVDAPQTASTQKVTYHVPAGSIPSLMLRQMAKELGCAIWLARGVVHCVPYKELLQRQPSDGAIKLEYQGNTQKGGYPIYAYRPIYTSNKAAREEKRQYMTWDTVGGFQISAVNEGCPRVFLPVASLDALDASVWRFTECMDADLCGCGIFSAGMAAGVRINRMSSDSVIDESIPLTQVFSVISHIQTPNSYKCAATMGIPQC